jgi:hypothetical protein
MDIPRGMKRNMSPQRWNGMLCCQYVRKDGGRKKMRIYLYDEYRRVHFEEEATCADVRKVMSGFT